MGDHFTENTLTIDEVVGRYKNPALGSSITIDAHSHMLGAGRYVVPGVFSGVRTLSKDARVTGASDGFISLAQLVLWGYTVQDFTIAVDQRYIDPYSSDFAKRAFLFGTEQYRIEFDGIVVRDGKAYLSNYRVVPFGTDNFDNIPGGAGG